MAKRKSTKRNKYNDLHSTTQKTEDWASRIPLKLRMMNRVAPEWLGVSASLVTVHTCFTKSPRLLLLTAFCTRVAGILYNYIEKIINYYIELNWFWYITELSSQI